MSVWTLNGAECCCTGLSLSTGLNDRATVEIRAGLPAVVPADNSFVTLGLDGIDVFYGRARSGKSVSGSRDAATVLIESPWALMEATVYQQTMKIAVPDEEEPGGYVLADFLTPEVQLGVDDAGASRTTLQELTAVFTYAAGAGIPITLDADFAARTLPPMALSGQTCAAAVMAILDYHPECVAWMSYSAGEATVSVGPLEAQSVVTVGGGPDGTDRVENASFKPALDYAPAGVRIVYFRTGESGRMEAEEETAGTTGTQGQSPNVINWIVQLEGSDPGPVEEQEIRTKPLPADPVAEAVAVKAFFRRHLPWFTSAVEDDIIITEYTRTVEPPGTDTDPSGEVSAEDYSTDPDDYPRELVSGDLRPWIQASAAPVKVTAKFAWSGGALPDELKPVFGPAGTLERQDISIDVMGTDASTRVYRSLGTNGAIPDWPTPGLASGFMAAFANTVYEGGLTLTGEAQPVLMPGDLLNVSGEDEDWADMEACIQSVDFDPQGHRLSVTCGPPRAMTFADFYDVQRVFKKRRMLGAQAALEMRTLARPGTGGKVRGGQRGPIRNVTTSGGGAGTAPASGLQTVIRKVGADWNVGVTAGIVQAVSVVTPTLEPAGTGLTAPATWFAPDIDATGTAATWDVWLLVVFDDSDFYAGDLSAAEVHLLSRDAPPDPVYTSGDSQWFLIGSATTDGAGGMTSVSHILNSARVVRRGGPGSGYQVYSA